MLSRVPPPPRRLPPDALDAELSEMANAILLDLPRVPPPPPPGARRRLPAEPEPDGPDGVQVAGRILLYVLAIVMSGLFFAYWVLL